MDKSVVKVVRIVFNGGESDVGFVPEPDNEGVPGGHEDPLSNVKFSVLNDHGVFNVFLSDPMAFLVAIIDNLHKRIKHINSPSPAQSRRLHYPYIVMPIYLKLGIPFLQPHQNPLRPFLQSLLPLLVLIFHFLFLILVPLLLSLQLDLVHGLLLLRVNVQPRDLAVHFLHPVRVLLLLQLLLVKLVLPYDVPFLVFHQLLGEVLHVDDFVKTQTPSLANVHGCFEHLFIDDFNVVVELLDDGLCLDEHEHLFERVKVLGVGKVVAFGEEGVRIDAGSSEQLLHRSGEAGLSCD